MLLLLAYFVPLTEETKLCSNPIISPWVAVLWGSLAWSGTHDKHPVYRDILKSTMVQMSERNRDMRAMEVGPLLLP